MRFVVVVMALLGLPVATLSGCHEGGEGDPCSGVDCSGHGECVTLGGGTRAECQCDRGYHPEGLDCVADGTDGDADVDSDIDGDADADADGDADVDGCPDGCLVGGDCLDAGDVNPDNVCQVCDPVRNMAEWSDNDGVACDDELFCNGDDTCSGGSCVVHGVDPCLATEDCFEDEGTCCALEAERRCDGNLDVIYHDSCGRPGGVADDCRADLDNCAAGECYVMFSEVWTSTTNGHTARTVAWGDLDGDGDIDLVEAGRYEHLSIFTSDAGVLPTTPTWVAPASPTDTTLVNELALADFDSDGDLDAAVGRGNWAYTMDNPNYIFENVGGVLVVATPIWTSDDVQNTSSVAWGDVDGDGDLDLAAGNQDQPNRIYRNVAGALETTAFWISSDSYHTTDLAWGDVDADGDLDLVVANGDPSPAQLYLNDGDSLPTSASWSSSETESNGTVSLGDMDGDGDLDLAVAVSAGSGVMPTRVYEFDAGTYRLHWSAPIGAPSTWVGWVDVDDDLDLDLVNASQFMVYLNDGSGISGASPARLLSEDSLIGTCFALTWVDLDSDGDEDFISSSWHDFNQIFTNDRY